jgi:hypothetical protein
MPPCIEIQEDTNCAWLGHYVHSEQKHQIEASSAPFQPPRDITWYTRNVNNLTSQAQA